MLAVLAGCGLRRAEEAALKMEDLQLREGQWVLADLNGKGGHIRTVPVPDWVKTAIDQWAIPASIISGTLFRSFNKAGRVWGKGFTPKVIWSIVKRAASNSGLYRVAPHDLRRTCAKLCHESGGELEQIQFLLGHVSVQTTERYLGCKQRFRNAVNDHTAWNRAHLEPWSIIPCRLHGTFHRTEDVNGVIIFEKGAATRIRRGTWSGDLLYPTVSLQVRVGLPQHPVLRS